MIQLSHTKKELYKRCPMAYYIHYVLKLREKQVGSALPFGSAIDSALGVLGKTKNLDEAKKEFIKNWQNPVINGQVITKEYDKYIKFYKSDVDSGMFEKDEEQTAWESLKRKGLMLLEGYDRDIMPLIKNVIYTQKKLEINNPAGDKIIGYVDKFVELQDGRIALVDDKTCKNVEKDYPDNVIQTEKASQLAGYKFMAENEKINVDCVAYFILDKDIRKTTKTGPRVRTKVIIDNPPKSLIKSTLDDFDEVIYNIKMGRFESNSPNCDTYFGKCPCTKFIESHGTNYEDFVYVGRNK